MVIRLEELLPLFLALSLIGIGIVWWLNPAFGPPAQQLDEVSRVAWSLVLLSSAAGVAAMATVQFWKLLFRPRAAFNRVNLAREFGEHAISLLTLPNTSETSNDKVATRRAEAHGQGVEDLLDNPPEVLMGHIRSAADYILVRPRGFEAELLALAGPAGHTSARKYIRLVTDDSKQRLAEVERSAQLNELLAPVRFHVEQHLNATHLKLRNRWQRRIRAAAVVMAFAFGLLAAVLSDLGPFVKVTALLASGLWGGFFSWFSRDLVALVETRRPKTR